MRIYRDEVTPLKLCPIYSDRFHTTTQTKITVSKTSIAKNMSYGNPCAGSGFRNRREIPDAINSAKSEAIAQLTSLSIGFSFQKRSQRRQKALERLVRVLRRDNVNVHRAAAKIIVSKSRAARGSVCNVLLSREATIADASVRSFQIDNFHL